MMGGAPLKKIEIGLSSQNVIIELKNEDKFKLRFIKKHIEQFQSLFPYKVFTSPAFIAVRKRNAQFVGRSYR